MRAIGLAAACAAAMSCAGGPGEALNEVPTLLADATAYDQVVVATLQRATTPCENPIACAVTARVVAATDSSGRIAYLGLDGKRPQVYLLEPGVGSPIATGRRGSGPGEYRGVYRVGLAPTGDVIVFDLLSRRFVRFGRSGRSGRDTTTAQLPMPATFLEAGIAEGSAFVLATDVVRQAGDSSAVILFRLEPGANKPTEVARLTLRQPSWRVEDMRPITSALDPRDVWALAPDGSVLHSSGSRFSISRFSKNGEETLRFGFDVEARAVGATDVAEASASAVRGISDPSMRAAASAQAGASDVRRVPAISALVAASDGTTWVREWPRASLDSVSWIRFAADGAPMQRVVLGADDGIIDSFGSRVLFTQSSVALDLELLRWAILSESPTSEPAATR